MRIFAAKNGVNLHDILLPFESFQAMGETDQVDLRRLIRSNRGILELYPSRADS